MSAGRSWHGTAYGGRVVVIATDLCLIPLSAGGSCHAHAALSRPWRQTLVQASRERYANSLRAVLQAWLQACFGCASSRHVHGHVHVTAGVQVTCVCEQTLRSPPHITSGDAHTQVLTRKRDKQKLRRSAKAERMKASRLLLKTEATRVAKPSGRLRPRGSLADAGSLGRRRGAGRLVKWAPTADSVVSVDSTEGRVVIGLHADSVPPMLAWVAPTLLQKFAPLLTRRTSPRILGPRGASVILNGEAESSSGPHKDCEPTLLLAVSGGRKVWHAAPCDVSERVQLRTSQAHLGASTFLPDEYDPTCNPPRAGVDWCGPVVLEAGSAMWIPAGWWHCVLASPHAVAVPCEVVSGTLLAQKPCVLAGMSPTKPQGGSGVRVSRRAVWSSARKVKSMFAARARKQASKPANEFIV